MSEQKDLVAVEQPQQVALTAQDRAVIALGGIEREEALKALAKKYADITEVKNKAGRQQVHGAAMELANERVAVKKTGETAREDAVALQKAVIAREKFLIGLTEPEEKRLLSLRDEWDEAEAAEKAAKLAAEKARIDAIRAKIDEMRNVPASNVGKSAEAIGVAADHLSECVISLDGFGEFAGEAQVERNHAVKRLREMQEAQRAHEAEQARLAAERVELERLRAEAAERERVAAAARAEQERADREAREREEARQKAEREAHEAKLKAEREASEMELRRQREAEESRLAEQRAELARQQAAIDAARAEQERKEREAKEAAEAEAARIAQAEADRIFAEQDRIAAEQARVEAERRAAELERLRREYVEFERNGPGDSEMVQVLAEHYDVSPVVVVDWLAKFDAASFLTPAQQAA